MRPGLWGAATLVAATSVVTDRTALDLDHVLAFGIGIALAAGIAWSRVPAAVRLLCAADVLPRPERSTSRS